MGVALGFDAGAVEQLKALAKIAAHMRSRNKDAELVEHCSFPSVSNLTGLEHDRGVTVQRGTRQRCPN